MPGVTGKRARSGTRRSAPAAFAVGADVGGTWTRVVAAGPGGRGFRIAARSGSPADLPALLARLWRRRGLSPSEVAALVVAARGVWTAPERRAAERRLAGLARRVRAIADVEAAYAGALGDRPGLLLLAGTGSIALGRDARGRWARAGGAGPLLGDEGSAFWIGRRWLAATSSAEQRRGIATAPDVVARVAGLAPRVLRRARRGDGRARAITGAAQHGLAALARDLARRLRLTRPVALTWGGSLMEDPRFRAGVWRAARRGGLAIAPVPPRESAVDAALGLAIRLAAGSRPTAGRRRAR
jgi:N-acetylglucosamine kinase-like BadF-type ATPase